MGTLKHATTPVHATDNEEKARWHDSQFRRLEETLKLPVSDSRRNNLQRQLLHHAKAAYGLRNPQSGNPRSQMRSYVGLDEYYFNG